MLIIEATADNAQRLLDAFVDTGLGTADLTTAADLLAHEITIFQDRVRIDVQTSTPGLAFADAPRPRGGSNLAGCGDRASRVTPHVEAGSHRVVVGPARAGWPGAPEYNDGCSIGRSP